MTTCRYYVQGKCKYGSNCRYEHPNPAGQSGVLRPSQFSGFSSGQSRFSISNTGNQNAATQSQVCLPKDILPVIKQEMLIWEKSKMWSFSCFGYIKNVPSLPGMDDISMEEVRLKAYEANKTGSFAEYQQWIASQTAEYNRYRKMLQNMDSTTESSLVDFINHVNNTLKSSQNSDTKFSLLSSTTGGQQSIFGFSDTTQKPSAFGASGSAFSGAGSGTSMVFGSSSLFSNAPPAFGSAASSQPFGSAFGSTANAPAFGSSTFGSTSNMQPSGSSAFGNVASTQAAGSLFGNTVAEQSSGSSVFGNVTSNQASGSSVFGNVGSLQPCTPSVFGNVTSTQVSGSLFGNTAATQSTGSSMFGNVSSQQVSGSSTLGDAGSQPGFGTVASNQGNNSSAFPTNTSVSGQSGFGTQSIFNSQPQSAFGSLAQKTSQPSDMIPTSQPGFGNVVQPSQANQSVSTNIGQNAHTSQSAFTGMSPSTQSAFASVAQSSAAGSPQQQTLTSSTILSQFSFAPPNQTKEITPTVVSNQTIGLFGKPASQTGFAPTSITLSTDDSFYTPLEQLTSLERQQFEADNFTLDKVPIRPPPKELC